MPILANKIWHIGSLLFTPLATANCFGEALTKRLEYPWITSRGNNIKDRTAQQNRGETGMYRSQGSELERADLSRGLVAICGALGVGSAMIIERV